MSRHPHALPREGSPGIPLGGSILLEWKLPLLMSALLAAGLAAMLAFTYDTLRDRAELIVRDRLNGAAGQVAGSAAGSMTERSERLRETARNDAVVHVLRSRRAGRARSRRTCGPPVPPSPRC